MNDNFQKLGIARSPYSRLKRTPLMPGSLWETKARFERMRKYLYKFMDEQSYIFPDNEDEQLIVDKGRELVGTMINILSDVLSKKRT